MKQKNTILVALVVSALAMSLGSASKVLAQQQIRPVADSGTVTLGPDQVLRITVASGPGAGPHIIVFRELRYEPATSGNGVTTLQLVSQNPSSSIQVMPDEAVSVDYRRCMFPVCGGGFVRGMVLSNERRVVVTGSIIDAITGKVTSQIIMANTEGDFH
jgi:hypothetical protein